jgi:hypothetical protein
LSRLQKKKGKKKKKSDSGRRTISCDKISVKGGISIGGMAGGDDVTAARQKRKSF